MKPTHLRYLHGPRTLFAGLALAALSAACLPGQASANTTANSTILNVVRVDYTDASGANTFAANASTIVTVNLVKAPLNASGAPTGANGNPGLTCLASSSYASGSTVSALYALSATANGSDTYNLSIADNNVPGPSTTANVTGVARSYSLLDYQGLNPVADPATRTLGSAIPTAVVNASTLEFPGGALAGFAANDIVLVDIGGTKRAFLVSSVTVGQAPIHSHPGNTDQTTVGGFTQAEVKGQLVLAPYADQGITLNGSTVNFGGGNTAPAFTTAGSIPTLGVPVGEMVLVRVDITASANTATDGDVGYTLTTTDSSAANPATITCTVGKFKAPTLTIKKEVHNFSTNPGGGWGATATGNPQQILEYRITVSNSGGQAAQVVVTDAVPAYTTLISFSGSYGGGAPAGNLTDYFARISNGTTNIDVTRDNADSETQPAAPLAAIGFGRTGATTAAGSPITFYLGDTSTNGAGGKLPACSNTTWTTQAACTANGGSWITSYTILYRVRID